ncbi:hypothetical protein IWQ62_005362 [Dispira parvispora]|uniref:Arrestin C-terminal-like domain-containing protein n=1 Tax=Dispira parvispora TaxID=1520584 RepID=A0A9W8E4T0_9FUNG|nr:hypothetical protein IWQ62_005362 [Dispira parvispora]
MADLSQWFQDRLFKPNFRRGFPTEYSETPPPSYDSPGSDQGFSTHTSPLSGSLPTSMNPSPAHSPPSLRATPTASTPLNRNVSAMSLSAESSILNHVHGHDQLSRPALGLLRSTPDVEIVLFDSPLVMHGLTQEAAGCMMRGQVVLRLCEPLKVRAIRLKFKGQEEVCWSEGVSGQQSLYREKKRLIEHHWSFDPVTGQVLQESVDPLEISQTPPTTIQPGEHIFGFEVALPGNLPETIHTKYGHVLYKLRAVVERPKFRMNLVHERVVPIKREPLPSNTELLQSLNVNGTWDNHISYEIYMPSRIFSDESTIPITASFTPQAKGIRVISVTCLLKEYVRYHNSTTESSRKFSEVVCRVEKRRAEPFQPTPVLSEQGCQIHLQLRIPRAYREVQYSATTNFMEVQHKLKVLVKLQDRGHHVHHIYVAAPVAVMYGEFDQEASSYLPPYVPSDPERTVMTAADVIHCPAGSVAVGSGTTTPIATPLASPRTSMVADDTIGQRLRLLQQRGEHLTLTSALYHNNSYGCRPSLVAPLVQPATSSSTSYGNFPPSLYSRASTEIEQESQGTMAPPSPSPPPYRSHDTASFSLAP